MPAQFEHDHLLHPTTLDAIFQSTFVPTEGTGEARVPTSFESIYVSANLPKGAGTELCGFATTHRKGFNNFISSIFISSKPTTEPMVVVRGVACTRLRSMSGESFSEKKSWEVRKVCSQITWKEDLTVLQPDEAAAIFTPTSQIDPEIANGLEKACAMFVKSVSNVLSAEEAAALDSGLSHYAQWMQDREMATVDAHEQLEPSMVESPALASDTESDLLTKLSKTSIDGRMLCEISLNLPSILDGSVSAQDIMEKNGLLQEYYTNSYGTRSCYEIIAKWTGFNGHKLPTQNILEIGSGTGSLSYQVLSELGGQNGLTPTCLQYTFSDAEISTFAFAKERLRPWSDWVQYKQLDIEMEPSEQDFQEGRYDVILAGHVRILFSRNRFRRLMILDRCCT